MCQISERNGLVSTYAKEEKVSNDGRVVANKTPIHLKRGLRAPTLIGTYLVLASHWCSGTGPPKIRFAPTNQDGFALSKADENHPNMQIQVKKMEVPVAPATKSTNIMNIYDHRGEIQTASVPQTSPVATSVAMRAEELRWEWPVEVMASRNWQPHRVPWDIASFLPKHWGHLWRKKRLINQQNRSFKDKNADSSSTTPGILHYMLAILG
jgi:hypothetical protein